MYLANPCLFAFGSSFSSSNFHRDVFSVLNATYNLSPAVGQPFSVT